MATWPVTLADAKAELNIDVTTYDTELQAFIDAATDVVEGIVGPVNSTTYTEWYDGGSTEIVLSHYPVLSVTSVTEYSEGSGTVLAAEPLDSTATFTDDGYQYDPTSAVLFRTSGGVPAKFAAGTRNVKVAYAAGRATPPAAVHLGALELIRHMWETQRAEPSGSPVAGYDVETGRTYGIGYLVPNRVNELLAPYRKAPLVV